MYVNVSTKKIEPGKEVDTQKRTSPKVNNGVKISNNRIIISLG